LSTQLSTLKIDLYLAIFRLDPTIINYGERKK